MGGLGVQDCEFNLGQVSGLMFMIKGQTWTDGTVPATDIQELAAWTTREAAADATKIQVLQEVSSFVVNASESINIAPDTNDTPEGKQINKGETTQIASCMVRNLPIAMVDTLKALECHSNLSVVLLTSNSATGIVDAGVSFDGISINSFFCGSPSLGGKTETNNTNITFNMASDWYVGLATESVNFNPLSVSNT
jgi:hypothetical protein|tara:strand:- start:832 stop:1416 length:585 start_codon:yes stop_codon:yes gene_type:complete